MWAVDEQHAKRSGRELISRNIRESPDGFDDVTDSRALDVALELLPLIWLIRLGIYGEQTAAAAGFHAEGERDRGPAGIGADLCDNGGAGGERRPGGSGVPKGPGPPSC